MKTRIFIGSSSESLTIATEIAKILSVKNECITWNQNFFGLNESAFNTLNESSCLFDYGIFVFAKDDLSVVRENLEFCSRDNVVYEYGLFMGALGKKKSLSLFEKGVKIPSDLSGVTSAYFEKNDDGTINIASLETACQEIQSFIDGQKDLRFLSPLPSTAIAIAYYNSFVNRVSNYFIEGNKSFKLTVAVPSRLSDNLQGQATVYFQLVNATEENLEMRGGRGMTVRIMPSTDDDCIHVVDVPTILNCVATSISLYHHEGGIGHTANQILLEQRELYNFKEVLKRLLEANPSRKNVEIIDIE